MPSASSVNSILMGNVYPRRGETLGIRGTTPNTKTSNPALRDKTTSQMPSQLDNAFAVGMSGHPLPWWIAILVLLVALSWGATKFDVGSNAPTYGNIRFSTYNIITIGLASVIFITLFKAIFTRWPIPGLSLIALGL